MGLFNILTLKKEAVKVPEKRGYVEDLLSNIFPNMGFSVTGSNPGRGALSISSVFAAVLLISNSIASLPINIKSTNKDEVSKVKFSDYLKESYISEYMIKKLLMSDLLLYGNGYLLIERASRKKIKGLRYLQAVDVSIQYNKVQNKLFYTCGYINGPIDPKDIIHIYMNTDDGVQGIGIIKYANNAIKLASYTDTAAEDYYSKGLSIQGFLHAKAPMNLVQVKQVMNSLNSSVDNSSNKNYYKFLSFDVGFEPITQSAQDAQLIDTRTFNISEIARYFNISPTLLQDLSKGTISDVEVANMQFLTQTLLPYIKVIENEMSRKLFPDSDYYIDIDETEFLRMGGKDTAEYYQTLVTSGILSCNEARHNLGYDAIEGGDKVIIAYSDPTLNALDLKESEEDKSKEGVTDEQKTEDK